MAGVGAFIGGKWEPNAVVTVEKGAHVPFHPTLADVSDDTKRAFTAAAARRVAAKLEARAKPLEFQARLEAAAMLAVDAGSRDAKVKSGRKRRSKEKKDRRKKKKRRRKEDDSDSDSDSDGDGDSSSSSSSSSSSGRRKRRKRRRERKRRKGKSRRDSSTSSTSSS